MDTANTPYLPISCEFHDLLEDHATLRKAVPVVFRDAQGAVQSLTERIADVYSLKGEEYLRMGSGQTIRLDQLIEVDGVALAGVPDPGA